MPPNVENQNEKLHSLQRQLIETQIKLNNVCTWIKRKFGEDPTLSHCDDEMKLLHDNIGGVPPEEAVAHSPRALEFFQRSQNQIAIDGGIEFKMESSVLELESPMDDSTHDTQEESVAPIASSLVDGSEFVYPGCSTRSATPRRIVRPPKKNITGYILYSCEARSSVAAKNSDKSFGEISRIVGAEWRSKSPAEKEIYEDGARKLNRKQEEYYSKLGTLKAKSSPQPSAPLDETERLRGLTIKLKKHPDWTFFCRWEGCDRQFEDAFDLIEHCTKDPDGHVNSTFAGCSPIDGQFQCKWKYCSRVKRGVRPFTNIARLLKHVRDIHVLKGNGWIVPSSMKNKNTMPSSRIKIKKKKRNHAPDDADGHHTYAYDMFTPMDSVVTSLTAEEEELTDPLHAHPHFVLKEEGESGSVKEETETKSDLGEHGCRVKTEVNCDQMEEIFLVDMTHLIPAAPFKL